MTTGTTTAGEGGNGISRVRLLLGLLMVAAVGAVLLVLWRTGGLSVIMDSAELRRVIEEAGALGPLLIIGLFMLAIVFNPLPSAPIALAAGYAYGHTWGTVYTVVGAVSGALLAFAIARLVGHDVLHRWFGEKIRVGLLGSQKALMATVFVLRLLPFVSFDIVSYAAGLTDIRAWRFLVATVFGVMPVSFVLAHFGSVMGSGDTGRISVTVLLLGLITLVPVGVKVLLDRKRPRAAGK